MTNEIAQPRDDFRTFRAVCMDVFRLWWTWADLVTAEDEDRVLSRSAPVFFHDLNAWLRLCFFVRAASLTDPCRSRGNENLTAAHFVDALGRLGLPSAEADKVLSDLLRYRAIIIRARSKQLAHLDLPTARSGEVLGAHDHGELTKFIVALVRFTDAVGTAVGDGPLDYRHQRSEGDIQDPTSDLEACQTG